MGPISLALLLAQTPAKPVDVPPNLAAYVRLHPDQNGLAVDPEARRPLKEGIGLARYNRKRVVLGSVAALVPLEMPQFDDSLAEPPNLYDGLPREAKVLYLLSTLRPDQIEKAAHAGLAKGDLQGEPRAVFESLLPKKVSWTRERLDKEANYGATVGKGELDATQIGGMRLRIERAIELEVPLADSSGSYTSHGADEENGRPGETVLIRNRDDEYEMKESFGVTIRRSVPNALKKGQLDTSRLQATVKIPMGSTVGEAAAIAGRSAGIKILADLRVRDRKLSFPAGQARAGDLLDALAYALQATYRRVGDSYMLVSDLTGLGSRKLRLAIWENDLQLQLRQKEAEWRRGLKASGAIAAVGYDELGGLAPNAAMLKSSERRFSPQGESWAPTADFPAEVRAFLERVNLRYSSQKVDTTRARASWRLRYRFVTTEGEPFQMEGQDLGFGSEFESLQEERRRPTSPTIPKAVLEPARGAGLIFRAKTPAEVAQAIALVRRYGFAELWPETRRADVLHAAIASGLPVRLVVRPWSADAGDELDRSILGDTASGAARRIEASEAAVRAAAGSTRSGWEREPLEKSSTDVVSPVAPGLTTRWSALQALAATPGLKGVVLLDTQPRGYEATPLDREMGIARRELIQAAAMGYSEAARLDFARKWSVDPIDLSDPELYTSVDLRPTLFLDDALRGIPTVYDGSQEPIAAMAELPKEWTKARGALNARAIADLLAGMRAETIWIEPRRASLIDEKRFATGLVPWVKGEPLPTFGRSDSIAARTTPMLVALPAATGDDRDPGIRSIVMVLARRQDATGAIDLGALPVSAWEARLGLWLTPVKSP